MNDAHAMRRAQSGTVRGLPPDRVLKVRQHLGLFRAAHEFDVLDGAGAIVLSCREPNLGSITRLLRFGKYKRYTPFDCVVRDGSGRLVLRISRGVSLFLSRVKVTDGMGRLLCTFEQQFLSIGPRFAICGPAGQPMGELSGSLLAFDFDVTWQGRHVAKVSKQWRSLGVELFTEADAYAVAFDDDLAEDAPGRAIALAAALVVDFVLKS